MASDIVPDYKRQKEQIQPLLRQNLIQGDECYLIDCEWLRQWERYTGYHSWDLSSAGKSNANPGPIYNANLFKDSSDDDLKDGLKKEIDYSVLPKQVYDKFVGWYGLSASSSHICRPVVKFDNSVKVDIYLLYKLKLCIYADIDNIKLASFSKHDTIKKVQNKLMELFEVPSGTETKVWQRYISGTCLPLSNLNQTLAEADIYNGQIIMLEVTVVFESIIMRKSAFIVNLFSKFNTEFLVLEDDGATLKSFSNDKKTHATQTFTMASYTSVSPRTEAHDNAGWPAAVVRERCFVLNNSNGYQEYLIATTPELAREWIDKLEEAIWKHSDTHRQLREKQGRLQEDHRQLQEEHRRLEREHRQIQQDHGQLQEKHRRLGREHRRLGREHRQIQQDHEQLQEEHRQLQEEHRRLEKEDRQIQEDHRQLQREHRQIQEDHGQLQEEQGQLQEEHRRLGREHRQIQQDHGQLQEEHRRLEREHRQIQEDHGRLQEEQGQLQEDHRQFQEEHRRLEREHTQIQEQLLELQAKFLTIEQSWKIRYKDVKMTKQELGRGGWAEIRVGKFRGQDVAVKKIYECILSEKNLQLLHREIKTMSQLRHPNLLQFIGAVLDNPLGGPLIITEVMEISLRQAYEKKQLTSVPVSISLSVMRDVAVGLNYLHCLPDPIIHRDVSSANVLLESKGQGRWKTKISDFGSANFACSAVTRAAGAIAYCAPEALQSILDNEEDHPLTPKMDVFSYGVLLCEILTCQFPDQSLFKDMLEQVRTQHHHYLHNLIQICINRNACDRPDMSRVIVKLDFSCLLLPIQL